MRRFCPRGGHQNNPFRAFSLSMEMSRLTRDGTAEPVSRDHILRRERGRGNIHFPCSADHEQNWRPHAVDPYSCYMCYHNTWHVPYVFKDQPGKKVAKSARGQLNRELFFFPVPVRAWEFGHARRVRQSRPASACSSLYSARLNWCYGIPPEFRGGVHLFII